MRAQLRGLAAIAGVTKTLSRGTIPLSPAAEAQSYDGNTTSFLWIVARSYHLTVEKLHHVERRDPGASSSHGQDLCKFSQSYVHLSSLSLLAVGADVWSQGKPVLLQRFLPAWDRLSSKINDSTP